MYPIDLSGKTGIVFGIANQRSIAWAIAQILHQAGMRLVLTYQNERLRENVTGLAGGIEEPLLLECDVSLEENVAGTFAEVERRFGKLDVVVHSIAFAQRDDLGGDFRKTQREGFRIALDVSAYSFILIARHAVPLMEQEGGSVITLTFQASWRVFPGYNIMGTAKAALEHEVRQLAAELGPKNIRVNAISPGAVDTLSSRVIRGFVDMKRAYAERSPLRRNTTQEDVARTALYLCSDLSSGVTGAIIPVDNGYSIMGI